MIQKRRLLFFGIKTFPSKGGTDRVAENLIRNLQDEFDITLFCFATERTVTDGIRDNLRVIRFRPLLKGSLGSFIYFFQSAFRALFMDVDLVHVHKTECALFIPMLRIRHRVIATSHEAAYLRDKWNMFQKIYFRLAERMFILTPNLATCISGPLTAYYQKRYGTKVLFIPNGIRMIPPEKFNHAAARQYLPPDVNPEKPYILFSARRLMATKGCHTMLLALHKISYKGQILIAGEINRHNAYLTRLSKLAEGLNVHFLGFIHPLETMLALISKCQLFVFPSETEGMSIMLLEAASVGSPVIASDIPENRIFSDKEILYFRNGDSDDLAEKLSHGLQHPKEMSTMGNRLRHSVATRYDWSWIANAYRDIYIDTIEGNGLAKVDLKYPY